MVPIHTHPPSKEYDEGWDRIFGKKKEEAADHLSPVERAELNAAYDRWTAEALASGQAVYYPLGEPERDDSTSEQLIAGSDSPVETLAHTDR